MAEEIVDLPEEKLITLQTLISARAKIDDDKPTDDLKIVRSYRYDQRDPVAFSIDLDPNSILTVFPDEKSKEVAEKTFGYLSGVLPKGALVMVETIDRDHKPSESTYKEAGVDDINKAIQRLSY